MKKLLALVLALVMSMSLVTISNAAFKDADKIDYKEAVDVMNAVGVFVGDEKGNFNAKENLTREQAAKIIAYLELGSKAADALVGGATFTDVASSRWSAGFVGYCAQAGVVAGYDGKFDPAGQLTALQFGKMLLVELGYDAKAAGMVGTDWAINTSKLMAKAKLMDGIDGSVNQVLTREKAAQMCLNALKTPTVEYATKGSNITVNGAEINFGASVPTYVTNTVAKEQTISKDKLTNSNEYTIELGEKLFKKLVLDNDTTDAFGRPTHTWKLGTEKIGEYADEATLTYTAKVELGDVYADLGLSKSTKVDELYVDGKDATLPTLVKKSDTKLGESGNGVLTQVYYDDAANDGKGEIIITQINTYVGKIQSVTKATSTADRYVTLTAKSAPSSLNTKFETEDFAKSDLVTYTAAYNSSTSKYDIQTVANLEKTTTGVLTQWKGDSVVTSDKGGSESNFTVDGTTYKYSDNKVIDDENGALMSNGIAGFEVNESDVNVYLDQYGYAIYVTGVEATKNYAAVIGIGKTNAYGSETKGVTLLLPDGTKKEVKAKIAGDDWSILKGINSGTISGWDATHENLVDDGVADIVTYTEDDGVYKLTLAGKTGSSTYTGNYNTSVKNNATTFLNGKSVMEIYNGTSADSYYTTSETIFMVATDKTGGKNYDVYVGYANAPSIDAAGTNVYGMAFVTNSDYTKQIDVVYIDAIKMAGVSGVDTYFVKADDAKITTDSDGKYYVLPAIIDGEETTIKVDAEVTIDLETSNKLYDKNGAALTGADATNFVKAVGLFAVDNVKKNSKGIITDFDLKNVTGAFGATNEMGATPSVGTIAANKVVLGIGEKNNGETYWAYNDKTAVYVVDKDYKTITVSSVANVSTDDNDLVFADYTTESGNKKLTDVIIVERDPAATPVVPTVSGDGVAESAVINRRTQTINVKDRVNSGSTVDELARAAMAAAGIKVDAATVGADGEYTYDVTLANGGVETLTTVTEKLYKVTVEFASCGWSTYLASYNKTLWMGETSAATLTVKLTGTITAAEQVVENTSSGNFVITQITRTANGSEAQATVKFATDKAADGLTLTLKNA